MKYFAIIFILSLACACGSHEPTMRLLTEQKRLKDSAAKLTDRIGFFLKKGQDDSVTEQKKQLGAVYARLTAIQVAIDGRMKTEVRNEKR